MSEPAVAQPAFHLGSTSLTELANRSRAAYESADPFPHAVFDGLLPAEELDAVLDEFPGPDDIPWQLFEDGGRTLKLATENPDYMGLRTRHLLAELNGGAFVDFLEGLTGIEGLVPDPFLLGGGLHQIEPGGFLDVHADFNVHPRFKLHRRLNVLIYLNKDWRDEWGGQLELWASDMTRCAQRIEPVFNRCVIFSTTRRAFHGHPQPVASPPGITRRSLALYYYSLEPPAGEGDVVHSTLYQVPGQAPAPVVHPDPGTGRSSKDRIRRWLPPAIAEPVTRWLRGRRAAKNQAVDGQ